MTGGWQDVRESQNTSRLAFWWPVLVTGRSASRSLRAAATVPQCWEGISHAIWFKVVLHLLPGTGCSGSLYNFIVRPLCRHFLRAAGAADIFATEFMMSCEYLRNGLYVLYKTMCLATKRVFLWECRPQCGLAPEGLGVSLWTLQFGESQSSPEVQYTYS